MSRRLYFSMFLVFAVLGLGVSRGLASSMTVKHSAAPARTERAVFAGGCFWCMETAFEGLPGVITAVSGYTGGHTKNPTYEEVGSHTTGHLESVLVTYDPARVTYAQLLSRFWHSIDPTQSDGQFCDRGDSYESAIFVQGAEQQRLAEASKSAIARSGVLHGQIVTAIRPFAVFYPAEDYHQDFYKKDPLRYRTYRAGCGRDLRLQQLWGKAWAKPLVH
ncbi:MAG: peptide-methionine (S)-S-oxide reductase MsrA [Candidatus Eisenbacteria bacterium]